MDTALGADVPEPSQWKTAAATRDDRPGETGRPGAHPPSGPSPRSMSKGRILIVDDDETVRETLADLLDMAGYCTLQAADALEALMIMRQYAAVVALVTDLTMPGADGILLIRHAREIKPNLPAILLTGYAEQITSAAAIAGGNFHVLPKPVESERLIEHLDQLVHPAPDA